mgnify:CR=1 FL=1
MTCPACKSPETHQLDGLDACFEVDPDPLRRCAACGHIFPDYESLPDDEFEDGPEEMAD